MSKFINIKEYLKNLNILQFQVCEQILKNSSKLILRVKCSILRDRNSLIILKHIKFDFSFQT